MADLHVLDGAQACKNCRHWQRDQSDFSDVAECRRNPPTRTESFLPARLASNPRAQIRERGKGVWPLTDESWQCGEFDRSAR